MPPRQLILIIDDNSDNCAILGEFLEDMGYQTVTASNGQIGLEKFFELNPHLVILDLRMPVMNGFEVLQQIREKNSATPILVVSAQTNIEDVQESIRYGATDYVTKPIELDQLETKIKKYLSS